MKMIATLLNYTTKRKKASELLGGLEFGETEMEQFLSVWEQGLLHESGVLGERWPVEVQKAKDDLRKKLVELVNSVTQQCDDGAYHTPNQQM